ncbi:MAG: GNAT family N-acetyltransferase [Spirochaetales bacterium]|nr:GNAT family N-acetyltransferase [Spirochaetales bacterium]
MTKNNIDLRRPADDYLDIIHKWLTDTETLKFYGGRDKKYSPEFIRREFGGDNNKNSYIIYYDDKPIGFLKYGKFDRQALTRHGLDEEEKNVFYIDILIGEKIFRNRGLGQRSVNLVLDYLFSIREASKVVLDTYVWHKQAIRCYEKCGLKTTRILKAHEIYEGNETDVVFMEISHEEYSNLQ